MEQIVTTRSTTVFGWFQALLRSSVQPDGDYFERLNSRIQLSAPVVCTTC